MKKFFLLMTVLVNLSAIPSHASAVVGEPNAHINCASTNLASSYTNVYPQLAVQGVVAKSHLGVVNNTSSTVCCNTTNPSPLNPPTSGNGKEICLPAATQAFLDFLTVNANVYCRSFSGTISSGTLDIYTW